MIEATLATHASSERSRRSPGSVAPLRVALMLESDGPGGAEVMLLKLAHELRRRGHHPIHVGPAEGRGWLGRRFQEDGFQRETFSLRRRVDFGCLRGLAQMLRRRRVDIVHSHEFTLSVYGAAAAKWIGVPHIITHHSNLYFSKKWYRRATLRWACRASAAVVAVSAVTRRELENGLGLTSGSVGLVYNGVDVQGGDRESVRREVGARPDESLLVALGTVEPRKGHILLLQALAEIRRRRPDLAWRLVIAGQDRYDTTASLRAFAVERGFGDRVHFVGFRKDTWSLLAAADIFTMPSIHEGLPMALLEAMRAGVPVVASRAGGIPEAITGEEEGLLVPVGDVPALASALELLIANPAPRRAIAERGRRRADSAFTVEAMTSAYEDLYHAAVAPGRRRDEP